MEVILQDKSAVALLCDCSIPERLPKDHKCGYLTTDFGTELGCFGFG